MDKKQKREMFCRTFNSESGRIVLDILKDYAHYQDGAFYHDARLQDYMQGRRSVVCEILNILEEQEDGGIEI